MSEKNKLAEKLLYAPKNGYDRLSAEDEKAMEAYCEDYKKFLNNGKTERLCVEYCIELAEKKGFKAYEAGMKLSAGHFRFVLKCLAENSSPIRNMKQYLLASLYNAPTTMQLSYQNQTNHDLAIRR